MRATTDLWLATFIITQGNPLADYRKLAPRKVEFLFDMDYESWKNSKLDYLKSDYSKFAQEMSKLRELNYE